MSSFTAWLKLWSVDWSKVSEVALGAILAFLFGFLLQLWLVRRQERFQKKMLTNQLEFMEKMERDRAANEEKADAARSLALAQVIGRHNETLRKIAMDNRNHESTERARDRSDARHRQM
jgi:hypothetical protein